MITVDQTPPNAAAPTAHGSGRMSTAMRAGPGAAGSRTEASHPLLRNVVPVEVAPVIAGARSQSDAVHAGAEVRVFAAGTRRLLATRFVDTGSGYDAQSDMPVHIGLASMAPVDVGVTVPTGTARSVTRVRTVSPAAYAGRWLTVRARE
jgi:hypothetical protein